MLRVKERHEDLHATNSLYTFGLWIASWICKDAIKSLLIYGDAMSIVYTGVWRVVLIPRWQETDRMSNDGVYIWWLYSTIYASNYAIRSLAVEMAISRNYCAKIYAYSWHNIKKLVKCGLSLLYRKFFCETLEFRVEMFLDYSCM